ncbi:MAG: FMN-binding protein [Candidatus Omnitrophica bacterium]|nr:FMN-binding protein [Candidatus Omnitrophota bacterium]
MRIFCLALTIIVLLFCSAYGNDDHGTEEAIKQIFPDAQTSTRETRFLQEQEFKIHIILSEGKVIGWAVVLEEMGKIKPITFLVGIGAEGKVIGVHVLEYRDMFGSEIKRRSFLRQFKGKSAKDPIKVGRNIDAVTGATISSQAATTAVKKSLELIQQIKKAER